MHVRRVDDPRTFLADAGALLLADEARHNVILGLAGTLRDRPGYYREHGLWLVEDGGGAVVGAALRTPPHVLAVARPAVAGAVGALAEAIDDDLPGVAGALPEVERFAHAWAASRGRIPRVTVRHGIFRLERVNAVAAPGAPRLATRSDLALLHRWWRAFLAETEQHVDATEAEIAARIELRLGSDGWGIALWEDGGEPVSLAAFGNPTPSGVRVGPVYTPPELRGRGYATALVAHVSQELLAAGRRFCFLYADLANPTANGIYRRIGYEQVCESANVLFA